MGACAACGTENPPAAKFCMGCGAALVPSCPSCGTENPPTAKFCIECGAQLGAAAGAAGAAAGNYLLDLGRVAESARVRLNGRDLGTLFARPSRGARP